MSSASKSHALALLGVATTVLGIGTPFGFSIIASAEMLQLVGNGQVTKFTLFIFVVAVLLPVLLYVVIFIVARSLIWPSSSRGRLELEKLLFYLTASEVLERLTKPLIE